MEMNGDFGHDQNGSEDRSEEVDDIVTQQGNARHSDSEGAGLISHLHTALIYARELEQGAQVGIHRWAHKPAQGAENDETHWCVISPERVPIWYEGREPNESSAQQGTHLENTELRQSEDEHNAKAFILLILAMSLRHW